MEYLGIDIGGANLKASTQTHSVSIPFPLWKHPEQLSEALIELSGQFPQIDGIAVTMTGELCDCFPTKRNGVHHILQCVQTMTLGRSVVVWGTDGEFHSIEQSFNLPHIVAAANWHALASWVGRFIREGLLIDIGSTTSDIIPILNSKPNTVGLTDERRLETGELVYTGVKRTPVCAIDPDTCAEFFAEMNDVYIILGCVSPSSRTDTPDGRMSTVDHAFSRLARMYGGDRETMTDDQIRTKAIRLAEIQRNKIVSAIHRVTESQPVHTLITSGTGEFLARSAIEMLNIHPSPAMISLASKLGESHSACGPAYAVASLARELSP